jgi:hypothetical protein
LVTVEYLLTDYSISARGHEINLFKYIHVHITIYSRIMGVVLRLATVQLEQAGLFNFRYLHYPAANLL